jgi:type IV pilus assembly protein PilC
MAKFQYKVKDPEGNEITGTTKGSTAGEARATLAQRDFQVIDLTEKRGILQFEITRSKIPRVEVMHFSRQLAAFVRAGVPLLDALRVMEEESTNKAFRKVLSEMQDSLAAGEPLSAAAAAHTNAFPQFFLSMLGSAELTGRLDNVLDQSAEYMDRDLEAKRKIRAALAYPAIILGVAIVAVVVLSVFVLPRFQSFFRSLGADLPLPTRMLIAATDWLASWWWALLAGIGVLILVLVLALNSPKGRKAWHRFLLKLPLLGPILRYVSIERFCRMLSALTEAGVPMPDAMRSVTEASSNLVYKEALEDIRVVMLEGGGLSEPIVRSGIFPGALNQMIRVGEDTGTLDQQLETAAIFYEGELDFKIKRLTTLFEPSMIIFVGVIVGFVAIALVSAMYGAFRQVGS